MCSLSGNKHLSAAAAESAAQLGIVAGWRIKAESGKVSAGVSRQLTA
jgi:hypothetical protein